MNLPTKLYHYSENPLKNLTQDFHDMHRARLPMFAKPYGFWLSIEDFEEDQNWKTWSEANKFNLCSLKHKYLVTLKKKAKILYLQTNAQLIEFGLKYKGNDPEDFFKYSQDRTRPPYIYLIDWKIVMSEYDGIIIAPFQWDCVFINPTASWYYGWDCSSGCIWNVSAVKSFVLESIQEERLECPKKEIH